MFTPLGDQPRWKTLYDDVLVKHDVGDVITYLELGEALGLSPTKDRPAIRSALDRAQTEYLVVNRRALKAVPTKGYQVVDPDGQIQLARKQQSRSIAAVRKGRELAENVDFTDTTPSQRKLVEAMITAFAAQESFNKSMDVRQRRLEAAVASMGRARTRTEAEIAELRQRLDKLEKGG